MLYYELPQDEATAAVLFCRRYPETTKALARLHNPDAWPEETTSSGTRRLYRENPLEELNLQPYNPIRPTRGEVNIGVKLVDVSERGVRWMALWDAEP